MRRHSGPTLSMTLVGVPRRDRAPASPLPLRERVVEGRERGSSFRSPGKANGRTRDFIASVNPRVRCAYPGYLRLSDDFAAYGLLPLQKMGEGKATARVKSRATRHRNAWSGF